MNVAWLQQSLLLKTFLVQGLTGFYFYYECFSMSRVGTCKIFMYWHLTAFIWVLALRRIGTCKIFMYWHLTAFPDIFNKNYIRAFYPFSSKQTCTAFPDEKGRTSISDAVLRYFTLMPDKWTLTVWDQRNFSCNIYMCCLSIGLFLFYYGFTFSFELACVCIYMVHIHRLLWPDDCNGCVRSYVSVVCTCFVWTVN